MGGKKRKVTSGPIKKESKYKIPTRFDCPLCDAKSAIAVKIMRSTADATVYCRSCRVGLGRRWKILPLEKSVDVFFRFREELMNFDRDYLEGNQITTGVGSGEEGGRSLLALTRGAPQERANARGAAGSSVAAAGAPLHGIDLGDDDASASHYFAPTTEVYADDEDEYAAMFQ